MLIGLELDIGVAQFVFVFQLWVMLFLLEMIPGMWCLSRRCYFVVKSNMLNCFLVCVGIAETFVDP